MQQPLHSLELSNIKPQELHSIGYYYCNDIDEYCDNFRSTAIHVKSPKTKTALDIYREECISGCILTLYKHLDEAMGGGILLERITEFCGEPGTGKTQLCFQLCVNVQLPVGCGGLAGEALYICTNKGFASHRIIEIAKETIKRYNNCKKIELNVNLIMEKIHSISIDGHIELIEAVKYLEKWLQIHSSVRLIIMDSIAAPLKILDGHERTVIIYNLFKELQRLAQVYHFAIVLTNDFTTRIYSANKIYKAPSLGDSYYHRINTRIELYKIFPNKFKARIIKSVLPTTLTETEFSLIV